MDTLSFDLDVSSFVCCAKQAKVKRLVKRKLAIRCVITKSSSAGMGCRFVCLKCSFYRRAVVVFNLPTPTRWDNDLNVLLPGGCKLFASVFSKVQKPSGNQCAILCCCFLHWHGNSTNCNDAALC